MMQRLTSIIIFLVYIITLISSSRTYTYNGRYTASGEPLDITIEGEVDVYDYLLSYCHLFKSEELCYEAMDGISWYMYGFSFYTPQHPNRTLEDSKFSRGSVLATLIKTFQYQRYLEIGCDLDTVFNAIKELVPTAVGVDPARGGTLRMTSDEFFAQNNEHFDLIYIDGLHTAEQTILDIQNALQVLTLGGSIVIHDCNPRFEYRQHRTSEIYNGDVWKVVAFLRNADDVEVVTVDVDHGVAVLRRRPNLHPLPALLQLKLLAPAPGVSMLDALSYQDLDNYRAEVLRLVTVAEFRQWMMES